jgi:hypothetical protein
MSQSKANGSTKSVKRKASSARKSSRVHFCLGSAELVIASLFRSVYR